MSEHNQESASRSDLLKWILHIIDTRIKDEEALLQQYGGNREEAIYFESRLKRDRAARALIAEDLEQHGDDGE